MIEWEYTSWMWRAHPDTITQTISSQLTDDDAALNEPREIKEQFILMSECTSGSDLYYLMLRVLWLGGTFFQSDFSLPRKKSGNRRFVVVQGANSFQVLYTFSPANRCDSCFYVFYCIQANAGNVQSSSCLSSVCGEQRPHSELSPPDCLLIREVNYPSACPL